MKRNVYFANDCPSDKPPPAVSGFAKIGFGTIGRSVTAADLFVKVQALRL
jgi:hypothetical protein